MCAAFCSYFVMLLVRAVKSEKERKRKA